MKLLELIKKLLAISSILLVLYTPSPALIREKKQKLIIDYSEAVHKAAANSNIPYTLVIIIVTF